jgi:hypothetical protein
MKVKKNEEKKEKEKQIETKKKTNLGKLVGFVERDRNCRDRDHSGTIRE